MSTILGKLERMQEILDYRFSNLELLKSAITHPSAVERRPVNEGYERLEFLGDAVVGFIVAEELFRCFPTLDEGGLSRIMVSLISGDTLSAVAEERGFKDCIIMGSSERGKGARGMRSALENVYEAVTGALYLDGGIEAATKWVVSTLRPSDALEHARKPENPKSTLQEKTQADLKETPSYNLICVEGPAHRPTFVCECRVGAEIAGIGRGFSKKDAEAHAAAQALVRLGYTKVDESDADDSR